MEHFGINIKKMTKTDTTMAEMEIDQNLSYEFKRLQESGKALQPVHGPGYRAPPFPPPPHPALQKDQRQPRMSSLWASGRYTGLQNLGNSCYLASVVQVLFSLPPFIDAYVANGARILDAPPADPTADLTVQLAKIGTGLLSGRYSTYAAPSFAAPSFAAQPSSDPVTPGLTGAARPRTRSGDVTDPDGIPPRSLKALVGQGHPEFSTMRQQDGTISRPQPSPHAACHALTNPGSASSAGRATCTRTSR